MTQATEVLLPTSADEAVAQFGDGAGVTVIGGGTIVMPEITYGRAAPVEGAPARARRARHAGRRRVDRDDRRRPPGRASRRARAGRQGAGPVRAQRRRLRDPQAGDGRRQPLRGRGSRRAARRPAGPAARARRAGALGGRRRRVDGAARGLPRAPATAACCSTSASRSPRRRRSPRSTTRTRTSTRCSPSPASGRRTARCGSPRPALAGHGARLRSAEAAAADPEAAGAAADRGRHASATTRSPRPGTASETLPVLVRRVLTELEEAA